MKGFEDSGRKNNEPVFISSKALEFDLFNNPITCGILIEKH